MLNTLILCPSARLVRSIKSDIARQHINAGQTQWQSPLILTLAQWLDAITEQNLLAGHITMPPMLLSPLNEQLLWQQVIKQSLQKLDFDALFDVAGLASAAIEANKYVVAWRLHIPREQQSEETRQFVQWQHAFQTRCKQLNMLETVRYIDFQLDALQANIHEACSLANISRVEFAGFDQTAPQEQRLREILISHHIEVAEYAGTNLQVAHTQHITLEHQEAECRAAVAWAQQKLTENPNAKLAIVSPKLSEIRNQLADLLDDVFYPASVRHNQLDTPRNYNFSLGTPLSQQPMIQAALNLLRLFSSYELAQADVSAVLLSPFWSASEQEADARAQLDAKMREYLPTQFKLTQWIDFASFHLAKGLNVAHLLAHIKAVEALSSNRKLNASQWAQMLADMLSALQWLGERVLTSLEFQASNAWQKALGQLKQLDVLGNSFYQAEVVQILRQICTDQVFQAETTQEASIQILGIMEALSAPVDAMWCMQMNDHIWPPPARPNPLLPAFLQRAAKLPNADNSVQAAFATRIHQRVLHSAKQVIFSSSQLENTAQLRPSPLIRDIETITNLSLARTLAETLCEVGNADLMHLDDHIGPAVQVGDHVSGGTGLFKAQAVCPAWAFYQYRLGAKSLKTPVEGLNNLARGQLVHAVLAAFWQSGEKTLHFADLRDMSDDALNTHLNKTIHKALQTFAETTNVASKTVLEIEHERLHKLVGAWLNFEKEQGVAFHIIGCELEKKVDISGIEVTLKIDRIHQLEDGGMVFVDYKTGQAPKINSWGEDRIIEPQLPIYASFYFDDASQTIAGLQFGMVKTTEHSFEGVNQDAFDAEASKRKSKFTQQFSDWQSLLAHFKTSIQAIAEEIKTGEASVKFNDEKELKYCEVLPLLRLPERQLQFERFLGSVDIAQHD